MRKFYILTGLVAVVAFALAGLLYGEMLTQVRSKGIVEKQYQQAVIELEMVRAEYKSHKNIDQIKRNDQLEAEIASIQATYGQAVETYETYLELRDESGDVYEEIEENLAVTLNQLAERDYEGAQESVKETEELILQERTDYLASLIPTATPVPTTSPDSSGNQVPATADQAPTNNQPPSHGFSRQTVATQIGTYTVSLVAGDLSSTRVLVDTASNGDCTNDCPVLPLAEYVNRNGGYAGINGTYFCPASYPSCAGKTNSFDLLVMNHQKTYFNSDNNVYSVNPAVIFQEGSVRFVSQASQWGRDTSPTGVLSNYPLLVSGGNNTFGGDDDPKKGSKAGRSFVAARGNTVYIGVVHNATVAEAATVLTTLGMEHAINLDSGGSTALYFGGYKAGPGRNIPNAIVFKQK